MTSVRCILVETTVPVRIRPRMETRPVKGHFLSEGRVSRDVQYALAASSDVWMCQKATPRVPNDSPDSKVQRRAQRLGCIPMYEPSMAVLGVLKPSPTSLYHRRPPFPTRLFFFLILVLRKMCGCFWKARSLWTVSSVAMFADVEVSCGRLRGV